MNIKKDKLIKLIEKHLGVEGRKNLAKLQLTNRVAHAQIIAGLIQLEIILSTGNVAAYEKFLERHTKVLNSI